MQASSLSGSGGQFQTSWSADLAPGGVLWIDPGCEGPTDRCKGPWEDGMRIATPGTYRLVLSVCFSPFGQCLGTDGDWENSLAADHHQRAVMMPPESQPL